MKLGVVSDTHSHPLPSQLLQDFAKVDVIIHAGDWCGLADYDALSKIKTVKTVHGNMDESALARRFPRSQILTFGSSRIGLFHGEGPPDRLLETVKEQFQGEKLDAIIFGHSHRPFNKKIDGVLYFNPGSPTEDVFTPMATYGIMDITPKGVSGKIVTVQEK